MGQGGSSANSGGDENKDEERKWTRFYKAKEKKTVNRQLEWEKNRSPEEKEADEEATRKLRKQKERERARARVEADYESSEEDEDRDEAKRKRKKKKKKKHHRGNAADDSDDEEKQMNKKGEENEEEKKKSDEQRRREEEEARRREKIEAEAELVDPVYEGDPMYSREKWNALWSFAKGILYFLFLAAGLTIYSTDYNKRPCVQEKLEASFQTYCLDYSVGSFACVTYDDATYGSQCSSQCSGAIPTDGPTDGCRYNILTQTADCLSVSKMAELCLDTKTCPDTSDSSIRRGALLISMLFLVSFASEMAFCFSLWLMADWTASDFVAEGGKYKMGWLFFVKNFPPFSQLVHIGLIFAVFYGLFLVMTVPTACKIYTIQTATGGTYAFYTDATLYVQITAVLIIATTVIGTAVRIQPLCHIRGQLFRPAPPAGRVPGWLVCDRCKSRPPPRLCPGCAETTEHMLKRSSFLMCFAWIPRLFAWILDKFATPLFILGKLLEWLLVNRHFVGP